MLRALPEGHRAHGFTCGRAELAGWPRSEIFAFAHDVRTYHGDLGPLLPDVQRCDIEEGARLAVGGLYHTVAHEMVSDPGPRAPGEGLRKMLFYAMLQIVYVRSGSYAATRVELLDLLDDDESSLLMNAEESFLADALEWAGRQLRGLAIPQHQT